MAKKPAGANFDYERASRALATAALEGDTIAATRENISIRTLQRYRKQLDSDTTLAQLVAEKKSILESRWADQIAPTLRAALAFLQRAANNLDPSDPNAVHAIAGAFKLVNEGHQTMRVIDARLAEHDRPDHTVPREVAAENSTHATTN